MNGIKLIWSSIYYILLLPIAGVGLLVEYIRILKNKCKRSPEQDPFHKVAPPSNENSVSLEKRDPNEDVKIPK